MQEREEGAGGDSSSSLTLFGVSAVELMPRHVFRTAAWSTPPISREEEARLCRLCDLPSGTFSST